MKKTSRKALPVLAGLLALCASACMLISLPANTGNETVPQVDPYAEYRSTPDPLKTPVPTPSTDVYVDGFSCSTAMAVALLQDQERVTCRDVEDFMVAYGGGQLRLEDPDWVVEVLNAYFQYNHLPFSVERDDHMNLTRILDAVWSGYKIPLFTVQTDEMLHAVLVVDYDRETSGYWLFDSRYSFDEWELTNDFLTRYQVSFNKARQYMFMITYTEPGVSY